MSFIIYDLVFLVLFVLVTGIFLYKHKSKLKRQGILYLYHTSIGLKIIERTTKKYSKILKPMQYLIIASGYILMTTIIVMIVRFSYVYLKSPDIARELKIPVLMPLIPYLPSLFKIDFLPPFYFTYWIIIIAVLAIPHEFFHGIFARLNKIKVHSTGFGFLGPFLAAFVEPDEKQMEKASKFTQLSILSSGTFANVLLTIFCGAFLWLFFLMAFTPSGVYFDSYALSVVNISAIDSINGIPVSSINDLSLVSNSSLILLQVGNQKYHTSMASINYSVSNQLDVVGAFDDSPAFNSQLQGAIIEFNGQEISSYQSLVDQIGKSNPGEEVTIKTKTDDGLIHLYDLKLGERNGKAYLGIARSDTSSIEGRGLLSSLSISFYRFLDPIKYNQMFNGVLYSSDLGDFGLFVYNLMWWLVLINLSVALVNMLPLGIFDGGRFFFVTVWAITGSKKIGEKAFKASTWILLFLVLLLMIKWAFAII